MVTLQIEADAAGTMMNDFLKSLSDEQKVEVATNFLEKAFQKEESWSRNMYTAQAKIVMAEMVQAWFKENEEAYRDQIQKNLFALLPETQKMIQDQTILLLRDTFMSLISCAFQSRTVENNQAVEYIREQLRQKGIFF